MRTRLFTEFPVFSDKFEEHLSILWSIDSKHRDALIPYVLELSQAETNLEVKAAKERAVNDIGIDPVKTLTCLGILEFTYRQWNPSIDTIEGFLKDLNEIGLIPPDKKEEIDSFFKAFLQKLSEDNTKRLENYYANAIIPNYIGASTTIDFRAVFEKDYGVDPEDNIGDFSPQCIGVTPVILVSITRDSGDPEDFEFQAKESSIRRLIDELEASIKNLRAAEAYLTGVNNGQ